MNGEVCCILGVCCPAGSEAQLTATVHMIQKARPKWDEPRCHAAALRFLAHHDHFKTSNAIIDETPEAAQA